MQMEELREFSKKLYGGSYRLEVAARIAAAEPGIVTAPDLTADLSLPAENYTVVRLELEKLAQIGLLLRLPKPRGQRIQEYERMPSEFWEASRKVLEEVSARLGRRAAH